MKRHDNLLVIDNTTDTRRRLYTTTENLRHIPKSVGNSKARDSEPRNRPVDRHDSAHGSIHHNLGNMNVLLQGKTQKKKLKTKKKKKEGKKKKTDTQNNDRK